MGDLVFRNQLQDQLRINLAQHDGLGPLRGGEDADIHACHMEEWHGIHHGFADAITCPFQ